MDMHAAIVSQYTAALRMMRRVIENCPDALWDDPSFDNRFWHVAYHALFYTHLYLSPSEAEFKPWERSRENQQFMGKSPWPPHDPVPVDKPYTQKELLEYEELVESNVELLVQNVPLESGSGFSWISLGRFELHIYNIRHLQHHTGQLIERLRAATGSGVDWVGRGE